MVRWSISKLGRLASGRSPFKQGDKMKLTKKQKKLPMALQKAIMKKKKKTKKRK